MAPGTLGLIEMGLTLVLVLGFGGWSLWSVNREIASDKKKRDASDAPGHAVGEHPLDER